MVHEPICTRILQFSKFGKCEAERVSGRPGRAAVEGWQQNGMSNSGLDVTYVGDL